jgi:CheY-like chemotaxis protein
MPLDLALLARRMLDIILTTEIRRAMNQWDMSKKRILVVDDEADVRHAIAMLLEFWGHEVVEAVDGPAALKIFQTGDFDIVTTDYVMPGMNGVEVARRLKQLQPDLPILMITAFPSELSPRENPADALLPKPFTIEQLHHGLVSLIQNAEALVTDER